MAPHANRCVAGAKWRAPKEKNERSVALKICQNTFSAEVRSGPRWGSSRRSPTAARPHSRLGRRYLSRRPTPLHPQPIREPGDCRELPQRGPPVRSRAPTPTGNAFWRILKATECLLFCIHMMKYLRGGEGKAEVWGQLPLQAPTGYYYRKLNSFSWSASIISHHIYCNAYECTYRRYLWGMRDSVCSVNLSKYTGMTVLGLIMRQKRLTTGLRRTVSGTAL